MREAVRTQILDAAEELIAAKGLHAAALVQIARRAGIAVGTLYNYFEDRDAMVRALFESRRATLRPKLLAAARDAESLPFEARLRQFLRDLLVAFDSHRRFLKVAIETEHLKMTTSTTATDLNAAIESIVAAGVSEAVIDANRAPLFVLLVTGSVRAVVLRAAIDGTDFVGDADAIVTMLLDGARH